MSHRDGFPRFPLGARGAAMPGIASHAGHRPKALGSRRSGLAGEPAVGDSPEDT